MSVQPSFEPRCDSCDETPEIDLIVEGRARDIGGFEVRRVLPASARRMVGPFIFFDHMGPARMAEGNGIDVRPHPHIHLATVTYLFDGEIMHRDSLGSCQPIKPGAINWMTAGRGITHSERSTDEARAEGPKLHGIQLWVALPKSHEEIPPEFDHYPAGAMPELERGGAKLRVLAGSAFRQASPVKTYSPLFYVEATMPKGSEVRLPTEVRERAAYVVEGAVACGKRRVTAGQMAVFARSGEPTLTAETDARVMLLGGDPMEGPRHIWWNFVSSSKERIEQAKRDWKEGRFPDVPGDEGERIPLPES